MKTHVPIMHSLALLALLILNIELSTAMAQDTVFTYQGRVTDNGTNFTGIGQFEFALVTSSNAASAAVITANAPSGGFITTYNLVYAGSGYTGSTVTLAISGGGGSGAAAHGNVSGGQITSVTVDNPGNGSYTSAPTVTVPPPPANISYTTYWSNDGTSVNGSEPGVSVSVPVTNGLFTVVLGNTNTANMDAISASLFEQSGLQLLIWFNDGVNGFATLTPAQTLTPTPYAVMAQSANELPGFASGYYLTNDSPDILGGAAANSISVGVVGAVIAGGGTTNFNGQVSSNTIAANYASIGGGSGNAIQSGSDHSLIAEGLGNLVASNSDLSSIGGGQANVMSGQWSVIGGGYENTNQTTISFIGGGSENLIVPGNGAVIGGGVQNIILTNSYEGTIAGGWANVIGTNDTQSTIGGGSHNAINDSAFAATIAGGAYNVIEYNAFESFIGGGYANYIYSNSIAVVVAGGYANNVFTNAAVSVISGGYENSINGSMETVGNLYCGTIGGGSDNHIYNFSDESVIGGGAHNSVLTNGEGAVIGGGENNSAGNDEATVPGGYFNQAANTFSTVGGGTSNTVNGIGGVIGGGEANTNLSWDSFIGGGEQNSIAASSDHAVIGGGWFDVIGDNNYEGVIGGGYYNYLAGNAAYGTIGGGWYNTNTSFAGVIAGGQDNVASGQDQSTVGGGYNNQATTNYATVPGGFQNLASGFCSFAAGSFAQATNFGSFVWADDSSGTPFQSTNNNSFNLRASGGVRIATTSAGTVGALLGAGDTSWTALSDRNAKKDFAPVDYQGVLDKLANVPIEQWHYKWQSADAPLNMGPMAQDFIHAFYPGRDDKGISTLEFDGVELAAIQGLNQKLNDRDAMIQRQAAEIADLKERLDALEQIVLKRSQ